MNFVSPSNGIVSHQVSKRLFQADNAAADRLANDALDLCVWVSWHCISIIFDSQRMKLRATSFHISVGGRIEVWCMPVSQFLNWESTQFVLSWVQILTCGCKFSPRMLWSFTFLLSHEIITNVKRVSEAWSLKSWTAYHLHRRLRRRCLLTEWRSSETAALLSYSLILLLFPPLIAVATQIYTQPVVFGV